jgi:hypothetical protein
MGWLLLAVVAAVPARSAEPERSPRRYIPARGLVAYLEYDGLDVHAEAWRATAAHDLLVKTPAGPMVIDLVKQLTDGWLEGEFGGLLDVADIMTIAEVMVRKGFTCGIVEDEKACHGMLVLKDIGRAEYLKRLGHLRAVLTASPSVLFGEIDRSRFRGRTIYRLDGDEPFSAWFEGDDLILVCNLYGVHVQDVNAHNEWLKKAHRKHIGKVLDCAEGKQLDASRHPAFLSARAEGKDLKGFEASGLWFVETTGDLGAIMLLGGLELAAGAVVPQLAFPAGPAKDEKTVGADAEEANDAVEAAPAAVDELARARRALDGIKRVVGRWGFQDKSLLSDIRIEAPAPRQASAAWLDHPAFRSDRVPLLPARTGTFLVSSIDLDRDYQTLADVLKHLDPDSIKQLADFEGGLQEATGLRLREDVLQAIGPNWCIYEVPSAARNDFGRKPAAPWDHVLVASIKDADKAIKVADALAQLFDPADRFWDVFFDDADVRTRKAARVPRFEPLPAPDRGYRLILPPGFSAGAGRELQPTLLVDQSAVVIARDLETARRAIAVDPHAAGRWQPAGELARALEGLPRDLTFLAVTDNAESPLPQRLAGLPLVVQRLVNLMHEPDTENAPIWSVLDVFGLPRPGGPRIRVDRSRIPDADRIRRTLLPSVLATAVDDRGFRIIGREPLPFLAIANELKLRYRWIPAWQGVVPRARESLSLTLPRLEWER